MATFTSNKKCILFLCHCITVECFPRCPESQCLLALTSYRAITRLYLRVVTIRPSRCACVFSLGALSGERLSLRWCTWPPRWTATTRTWSTRTRVDIATGCTWTSWRRATRQHTATALTPSRRHRGVRLRATRSVSSKAGRYGSIYYHIN